MNCENGNTTVHYVCPAWSTLMFLVLVCLFVMMSPYKNALKPVFAPHRAVFQMHTYCKYSLKMLSDCRDILENVSCLKSPVRVLLRVYRQLPEIQKVGRKKKKNQ